MLSGRISKSVPVRRTRNCETRIRSWRTNEPRPAICTVCVPCMSHAGHTCCKLLKKIKNTNLYLAVYNKCDNIPEGAIACPDEQSEIGIPYTRGSRFKSGQTVPKYYQVARWFVVKYADDFIIFLKTARSAHRVKRNISRFITKELHLLINTKKSAIRKPMSYESHTVVWVAGLLLAALSLSLRSLSTV